MFPIIIELRKKGPPAGAALKGMPGNPFLYEKDRAILKALGSKLRLVATAETQQQNANMPCNEVLHGQVPVLAAQMHLMVQEPVSCPEAATAVGAAVARARAEGSVAASTGRKGGSYVYKKRVVSALVTLQSNPAGGRPRLVAALVSAVDCQRHCSCPPCTVPALSPPSGWLTHILSAAVLPSLQQPISPQIVTESPAWCLCCSW